MPSPSSFRPNVLVFFTDQQRWDTVGLHGNPLGLTPNFDRLARSGTFLKNTFTCQPVCGPARSCLQSGQYATSTGCWRNGIPLPATTRTLAHHFAEAGYRTGYIGKWHLAGEEPVQEEHRGGYEYWLAANALEHTSEAYRCTLFNNQNKQVTLPGYRVDGMTDAAIRYMDSQKEHPFFLTVSFLEPHHQNRIDDYPSPVGYRERFTGRWIPPDLAALGGSTHQHLGGYYGMVKRLDEALGRMVDALISLELLDSTLLLFITDHGCHFKTRNSEYKRSCHESSVRLPAFLHGPGFMGGGERTELVSLLDLPPTLLGAAGLPADPAHQGRDFSARLKSPDTRPWENEVYIQISESCVGRALRTNRWKYGITAPARLGNHIPHAPEYEETELYDLEADPYELTNLAGSEATIELRAHLRSRMLEHMTRAGETPAQILESPSTIKKGQRFFLREEWV